MPKQDQLNGFLIQVKQINPGFRESGSSLSPFLTYLRQDIANQVHYQENTARQRLGNDGRIQKYRKATEALLFAWGTNSGFLPSLVDKSDAMAAAYRKARLFHGFRGIDAAAKLLIGLRTQDCNTALGSADPGRDNPPNPIYLGRRYQIAMDYSGNAMNIFRLFLDNTRMIAAPFTERPAHLMRTFNGADGVIYRDPDNPSAVYTMMDIGPNLCVANTLTADILTLPASPRAQAVLNAIKSHDMALGALPANQVQDVFRYAVQSGRISDTAAMDA